MKIIGMLTKGQVTRLKVSWLFTYVAAVYNFITFTACNGWRREQPEEKQETA